MSVRDLIPWGRSRDDRALSTYRDDMRDPFEAFHHEVDRLFDDFFRAPDLRAGGFGGLTAGAARWPNVEISETDDAVKVSAELPGLNEKNVELVLENGVLIIRGEKEHAEESNDPKFSERYYGRFERRIELPVGIEEDKIDATFADGVLNVTLPKSPTARAQVRRIEIKG